MPTGKTWSKNQRKWVNIDRERKLDFEGIDTEAAKLMVSYWRQYPDKFVDLLEAENPEFSQEIIQRINLRAFCRYQEVFITASRGTTKTHEAMKSRLVMGVLYPGIKMQYYGPTLRQTAEIASSTYQAIAKNYPGLCSFWEVVSDATERFELRTKYGSTFSITNMRGQNCHSVLAEETAQEETGQAFDHEKFRSVVLPSVRLKRMVNKEPDPVFPNFQKLYITSAGRQQNESFSYREQIVKCMEEGKSAFAIDYPSEIAVLSGIRDISWRNDLKRKLTPEEWMREMDSIWTGTAENPVVRDAVLTESKNLMVMENRHCGDPNVIYIVGNDVSYIDGANNAKCATVVLKCETQQEPYKRSHYLKSFVYMTDNPPPRETMMQAKQLKERWRRFCLESGGETYIAIDAASYGRAVLEDLHKDLNDGLPPLCCINHDLPELELDGALPVIYPIRATGGFGGTHDPDSEMLKYAELQFEQSNVRLLSTNIYEGVAAYKRLHRIKDDELDATIAIPYLKTKEFCGQVANLKKKVSGIGMREVRISNSIQRDMWSAAKYALRLAQILEYKNLLDSIRRASPWEEEFKQVGNRGNLLIHTKARVLGWAGGNRRK